MCIKPVPCIGGSGEERTVQFSMKTIGVPLVLLVLIYLSVSNHHQNLLLSVYDYLSNTKPGRFAFFLATNFIALIISLRSSKTSEADFEGFFPQTSLLYESNTTTVDIDDKFYCGNNVDDNEHQGYDGSDEDINSDDVVSEEEDDDDDDENDTDTDNEMVKRAEEFIEKVKQKWREELLTDRLLCITAA